MASVERPIFAKEMQLMKYSVGLPVVWPVKNSISLQKKIRTSVMLR